MKVKAVAVVAVPVAWLLGWLGYQWFELELVVSHPLVNFVLTPLNYVMLLTGCMSIILSVIIANELRSPVTEQTSQNPIGTEELDEIKANIEELQEAVVDIRAMLKLKPKEDKKLEEAD